MSIKGIWWLASYPKSGNTWLRMLLNAYINQSLDINSMPAGTGDNHRVYYQSVSPLNVDELSETEKMLLRPAALINAMALSKLKPVMMKTHFVNGMIGGIPAIPPAVTAGAVYIVRDPRDLALSIADHMDQPIDWAIACMNHAQWSLSEPGYIRHLVGSWSQHVRSWSEAKDLNVITIRYEDMLANPFGAFSVILKHMNIEVFGDRLNRAIEMTSFETLKETEQANGFREAPKGRTFFNRGKAGCWKDVLNAEQVRRIEHDQGDVMRELEYLDQSNQSNVVALSGG